MSQIKKVLVIINPLSGGKDKSLVRDSIISCCSSDYDYKFVFTEYRGHAKELAQHADADIVVAVGGDGTINEVASGLAGSEKTLGVIPMGSGNGFANHLHIPHSIQKAVSVLETGNAVEIDQGIIDGRAFLCTCGIGLDAEVGYWFDRFSKKRGLLEYARSFWAVWKTFSPQKYKLVVDGRTMEINATLITIANANQWGNQALIAPNASLKDGLFDVTIIKPVKFHNLLGLFVRLFLGTIDKSRHAVSFRCSKLVAECAGEPQYCHYDGEPMRVYENISISFRPDRLKVLVPDSRDFNNI